MDLLVEKIKQEKKYLEVAPLKISGSNASINEVSLALDGAPKNLLQQIPWDAFNYLPRVQFALAYNQDFIFLKYYVNEKFIRAANVTTNSAVCEDTCVEFFISFDDGQTYYNFEFNCIGTTLAAYGNTKKGRTLLADALIKNIIYQSLIKHEQSTDDIQWELTVAIPLNVFSYHAVQSLTGKKCRANFYKCGDLLPVPHYVTWSNIISPEPDFHLPEFFGTLQFL